MPDHMIYLILEHNYHLLFCPRAQVMILLFLCSCQCQFEDSTQLEWLSHNTLFNRNWNTVPFLQIRMGHKAGETLQWRHNERDGVSNHQPHDCWHNRLFKAQIKGNKKAPRHWPLWGEFTGDWWILHTKGQQRGKCFHLMTSSWGKPPAQNWTAIDWLYELAWVSWKNFSDVIINTPTHLHPFCL